MGIGCFPEDHPLSLKWLGMHGTYYANRAVNEADLLLAFGVRFDDRVTGKVSEFAKHGRLSISTSTSRSSTRTSMCICRS